MKMAQAWGWLAVAVLAAGLNASYHDGGLRWAHRVVDQVGYNTSAVWALATGRSDQFLTEARYVAGPQEMTPCRFSAAIAQAQEQMDMHGAELARVQVMTDRQVARLQRIEAKRAQVEARLATVRIPEVAFTPVMVHAPHVVCPRVRVNISKPMIRMPAIPEVHVESFGAGPV